MSDPNSPHPQAYTPPPPNPFQPAIITYAVFGLSFLLAPIAIGALIYAYIAKGKSAEVDSHLNFMIRTFWVGLVIMVVGFLTTWLLIGFVILLGWFVWVVVRMITGFQLALARQPIQAVELFGMKAV